MSKADKAKIDKMINFCNAIICIAKSENTSEGDAIKALALDVARFIEALKTEEG